MKKYKIIQIIKLSSNLHQIKPQLNDYELNYNIKMFISQVSKQKMFISAKGLYEINRKYLAAVSL